MPDYQLEIAVVGYIRVAGKFSRFEADDSLSIFQIHRVGLAPILSKTIKSSLQNNYTVLGVEFQST
jgi:hypothetical protein